MHAWDCTAICPSLPPSLPPSPPPLPPPPLPPPSLPWEIGRYISYIMIAGFLARTGEQTDEQKCNVLTKTSPLFYYGVVTCGVFILIFQAHFAHVMNFSSSVWANYLTAATYLTIIELAYVCTSRAKRSGVNLRPMKYPIYQGFFVFFLW